MVFPLSVDIGSTLGACVPPIQSRVVNVLLEKGDIKVGGKGIRFVGVALDVWRYQWRVPTKHTIHKRLHVLRHSRHIKCVEHINQRHVVRACPTYLERWFPPFFSSSGKSNSCFTD